MATAAVLQSRLPIPHSSFSPLALFESTLVNAGMLLDSMTLDDMCMALRLINNLHLQLVDVMQPSAADVQRRLATVEQQQQQQPQQTSKRGVRKRSLQLEEKPALSDCGVSAVKKFEAEEDCVIIDADCRESATQQQFRDIETCEFDDGGEDDDSLQHAGDAALNSHSASLCRDFNIRTRHLLGADSSAGESSDQLFTHADLAQAESSDLSDNVTRVPLFSASAVPSCVMVSPLARVEIQRRLDILRRAPESRVKRDKGAFLRAIVRALFPANELLRCSFSGRKDPKTNTAPLRADTEKLSVITAYCQEAAVPVAHDEVQRAFSRCREAALARVTAGLRRQMQPLGCDEIQRQCHNSSYSGGGGAEVTEDQQTADKLPEHDVAVAAAEAAGGGDLGSAYCL